MISRTDEQHLKTYSKWESLIFKQHQTKSSQIWRIPAYFAYMQPIPNMLGSSAAPEILSHILNQTKPNMAQTCQCHQSQRLRYMINLVKFFFSFFNCVFFATSASVCLWGENVNTPTVCRCFLALINPKKDSQIEDGRSDQHRVVFILPLSLKEMKVPWWREALIENNYAN